MKNISVILTVHNKQKIIEMVLINLLKNLSENTKELIIVLDGCNDKSEEIIKNILKNNKPNIDIILEYTSDIWEVKANNVGIKKSKCDYSLLIQDDMVIVEKEFDIRLMKPFLLFDDIFAVTSRDAHNITLINGKIDYPDLVGKYNFKGRNIFAIRDVVNRGPLLLDNNVLFKLNYLDEEFAPLTQDDHDLCLRAYKKLGLKCGSYVIDYISEPNWGSTRTGKNAYLFSQFYSKNEQIIIKRHYDLLVGLKHNEERII